MRIHGAINNNDQDLNSFKDASVIARLLSTAAKSKYKRGVKYMLTVR